MSNDLISVKTPRTSNDTLPKLRVEDGWVFRERPGVPVECLRRAEHGEADGLTQPNQVRHDYPGT